MNMCWRQLFLFVGLLTALNSSPAATQTHPDAQASGQQETSDGNTRKTTDELYQSALQSIAEGRKTDASNTLKLVIEHEPLHAGAWLDLALLQCGLGHAEEAERLFTTIEQRFTLSPPMRAIIVEVRASGCRRWRPASLGTVTFGRGIDQNVNQGARTSRYVVDAPSGQVEFELSDDFKPRHDQYVQLSGEHLREITPNGSVGFIQYQFRRNDALHQYDNASLFTGFEAPWRYGHWRIRMTGTVGLVTLGSALYQRQAQLQARITPPIPLPDGIQFDTVVSSTRNLFQALSNFDSSTQEIRTRLTLRTSTVYSSASFGWQNDHALADRPGGSRKGTYVNVLLRHQASHGLNTELGYMRQTWRSRGAYSPGLIEQVRDQATHTLRVNVSYPVGKNQALLLEGRMVHNHENISIFQYNNRQLQLSWQQQFP